MPLCAGEKLGSYEILAPIGKGCMGEFYRAGDTKLKCDIAIKVPANTFVGNQRRMGRFQRVTEVLCHGIAAVIKHRNHGTAN